MSKAPSTLFDMQRSVIGPLDADCRLFKVQVASSECPPPRNPYRPAAFIAEREQFEKSVGIVSGALSRKVIETTEKLMSISADFGAAALNSHDLFIGWRSRQRADPCPDPRARRWPTGDEDCGGDVVWRLEEEFRVYTEQFLCLASQVASYSANMRASVSYVGLPTEHYYPAVPEEEDVRQERDALAERLKAMEQKAQEYEEQIRRLEAELQKKGRSSSPSAT